VSEAGWRASRLERVELAAIAAFGHPLLAALGATLRWRAEGEEHLQSVIASGRQPILALWHGRILPATLYFRDRGIVAVTSENFDGEWTARLMRRFGYRQARGSTSRGGARALRQLIRDTGDGRMAAFTVDGPRGPACQAQPGAVWLAKVTGNPIVPFHVEASPCWTARSWDRAQIPKPWSRVAIVIGEPMEVAPGADDEALEAARIGLDRRLGELRSEALRLLAWRPPRRPGVG
jgi:lysophospholipid acyltransferase (LPLAT)-like uncharacterized protein